MFMRFPDILLHEMCSAVLEFLHDRQVYAETDRQTGYRQYIYYCIYSKCIVTSSQVRTLLVLLQEF